MWSITDKYKYLGLVLNVFLDFSMTAKLVAQSASRALGLLIAKCKSAGGMPYDVSTKLYESMVLPVIAYGAAVWDDKTNSCINAVKNRAMRFFLGVGKYTLNAAASGDMRWSQPALRQWKFVLLQWHRFVTISKNRLNCRMFSWFRRKGLVSCKNWCYSVIHMFHSLDLLQLFEKCHLHSAKHVVAEVVDKITIRRMREWQMSIDKEVGTNKNSRNKLRFYRLFKRFFATEEYCKLNMPFAHRAACANFRCGVAPLKIETGRYLGQPPKARICPFYPNHIEDEQHVILNCPAYDSSIFRKASSLCEVFCRNDEIEKIIHCCFILYQIFSPYCCQTLLSYPKEKKYSFIYLTLFCITLTIYSLYICIFNHLIFINKRNFLGALYSLNRCCYFVNNRSDLMETLAFSNFT